MRKTMTLKWYQLLVLPAALMSAVSFGSPSLLLAEADSGEEPTITEEAGTTTSVIAAPTKAESGPTGSVELRPTMYLGNGAGQNTVGPTNKNRYGMENTVEAGYKFNKDLSVIGHTEINNNFKDVIRPGKNEANVWFGDTILRMPWNNIWKNAESGTSFSWEPRLYFPTNDDLRPVGTDLGYVGQVRNYLKLKQEIVPNVFSATLMEIPVFKAYSNAGTAASPNPIFENRVYLVLDTSFFNNKLAFSLPFLYYHGFKRTIAGAPTGPGLANGSEYDVFYIWPELTYAVAPNFDVGVAYQTDNFLQQNFAGNTKLKIGDGFENGMFQVILRASL